MGYRLRVCKTYKVEYADKTGFNWRKDELITLLEALGCSCIGSGEENENDTFEVDIKQYSFGLKELQTLHRALRCHNDMPINEEEEELLEKAISAYGREYFVQEQIDYADAVDRLRDDLQEYYDLADKGDGYLHFIFF